MIPAGFIFLERMPLTAHGKVDRPRWRRPARSSGWRGSEFVAPRNSTEEVLADIWADLLEVEDVGVFDNFFDLGGHSLLAGRVLARVANAFGVSLPIRALFEAPTVEALARRVDEAGAMQSNEPRSRSRRGRRRSAAGLHRAGAHAEDRAGIPRTAPVQSALRLSAAGAAERRPRSSGAWPRSCAGTTRCARDLPGWTSGPSLSSRRPPRSIHSSSSKTLRPGAPARTSRAKALLLKKAELQAEQEAWTPFDMTRAPLFRTRLLRLGADDHVLLLILHHIIVDGWSIGVFIEEVSELYSAFTAGRQAQLPEPALQFSDFARWQRRWCTTDAATRQFAYWKEHLREASPVFPRTATWTARC